jgi:hypothetical protein
MTYHLPMGLHWNETIVCETLRDHCVDARVSGTRIRISLPDESRKTILARLWRLLLLRRPTFIFLNYNPTKFIRNVEINFPWPQTRAEMRCREDIDSAMLKLGCRKGSDQEIATHYCPENNTLDELFDEIDRLHNESFRCVQEHNFENASLIREEQILIQNRIDAILFASVSHQSKKLSD